MFNIKKKIYAIHTIDTLSLIHVLALLYVKGFFKSNECKFIHYDHEKVSITFFCGIYLKKVFRYQKNIHIYVRILGRSLSYTHHNQGWFMFAIHVKRLIQNPVWFMCNLCRNK